MLCRISLTHLNCHKTAHASKTTLPSSGRPVVEMFQELQTELQIKTE